MAWLLLAVGGGIGAMLRDLATRRFGAAPGVDVANRVGAVLLGVVVAAAAAGALGDLDVAAMGTGVAGGLTTFSTWVVQVVEPPHDRAAGPDLARLLRELGWGLFLASVAMLATGAALA